MDMKKMGTALLTGVLAASLLAGCGSSQKDAGDANKPLRVATNATSFLLNLKTAISRPNTKVLKWI